MNKIIFLDIDGVLNGTEFLEQKPTTEDWWLSQLNLKSIVALNLITRASKAKIVIISTWRIITTFDTLCSTLKKAGVKGEIIGCTPYMRGHTRNEEIKCWLKSSQQKIDSYVIIDDITDDFDDLSDRAIKTDPNTGLTEANINSILEVLNN